MCSFDKWPSLHWTGIYLHAYLPTNKMLSPNWSRSWTMLMWPRMGLPTRQVKPTTSPFLLLIADIRCKVPSMPALFSSPNSPTAFCAYSNSFIDTWLTSMSWINNQKPLNIPFQFYVPYYWPVTFYKRFNIRIIDFLSKKYAMIIERARRWSKPIE